MPNVHKLELKNELLALAVADYLRREVGFAEEEGLTHVLFSLDELRSMSQMCRDVYCQLNHHRLQLVK